MDGGAAWRPVTGATSLPERGGVRFVVSQARKSGPGAPGSDNRIVLRGEQGKAVVSLNWLGKKKKWLLSANRNEGDLPAANGRTTGYTNHADSAFPAEQEAGRTEPSVARTANGVKPDQTLYQSGNPQVALPSISLPVLPRWFAPHPGRALCGLGGKARPLACPQASPPPATDSPFAHHPASTPAQRKARDERATDSSCSAHITAAVERATWPAHCARTCSPA